jgi:hypothetical protein
MFVDAARSFAERIEINLAKLRQDHRVLKLARLRIIGAGKYQRTRVSHRKRARTRRLRLYHCMRLVCSKR